MKNISWNTPKFGKAEAQAVARVLKSGFVTEGAVSNKLVEWVKAFLGVKHVILTTSGSAALFLAVKADQIIRGLAEFEVLVPNLTFIASASSVEQAGGTPVLVDVEGDRFCIDVDKARKKITRKTRGIMPVHIMGRGCNMREIGKLAKDYNLIVIEDAANALGSRTVDGYLGTIGSVGCFSLQANKSITCGHGGFITTDDTVYFEVMTRLKDFGRYGKQDKLHKLAGFNFKFNDILASVVVEQAKRLPGRLAMLCKQRLRYELNLAGCRGIKMPSMKYKEGEVPLYVDVLADERDKLQGYLAKKLIRTRECWSPLHRNPPYQGQGNDLDFPVSCKMSDSCLWLPNGNTVSLGVIDEVCSQIRKFYA
jgi:perosamine synthetase